MCPRSAAWDFCRQIKREHRTRLIPVLILTSVQGPTTRSPASPRGPTNSWCGPVHPAIVRARIRSMLRHKAAIDSLEEAESILFALAQAIEQRDKCTGGHCERLSVTSIAPRLVAGPDAPATAGPPSRGFLHDIGKIAIPIPSSSNPARSPTMSGR